MNIDSICMSIRHDFGLLSTIEQDNLRNECKQWVHAISKESQQKISKDFVEKLEERYKRIDSKLLGLYLKDEEVFFSDASYPSCSADYHFRNTIIELVKALKESMDK